MKNIDQDLIQWAIHKITSEYPEDVALLIGQIGGCKIPTDEQMMAFDFFVPATERGNQLAKTFIIENMGYDLYPISWERLEGIANFAEPRMIFAFDKGEVIYARSDEERERFYSLKQQLHNNLNNPELTFQTGLQYLNTAMEIYNTMLFEESLGKVRKAAGGICCYLMNAIAMVNGTYLKDGYENLRLEMKRFAKLPNQFQQTYESVLAAESIPELLNTCYQLLQQTRDFFVEIKPVGDEKHINIYYEDLAEWYYEARYTFRRIEYYVGVHAWEECFLLGCYLQIEFDAIGEEFGLNEMDLLGAFHKENLEEFAQRAKHIEDYIVEVLLIHHVKLDVYQDLADFLRS